jgi:uncharacterized protein YjbI with pentapeptide repeats
MPDSKIDSLDVGALERAVNDSANRVSGIWLSFVAFSAYVAAAASMITHRQLFLEESIKLPTINIDVPLIAAAILLPLLFTIYHLYVLIQVLLLARTADAYNDAIARAVPDTIESTRVRQRLANTLFAQLFAGSPREREGVLGWLLRLMSWITLAIAPVFVLIVFEIKFLPYHSALVTWTHRGLIAADLLAVLYLWAGAIKPATDITIGSLRPHWRLASGAVTLMLLCCVLVSFPGEPGRAWMKYLPASDDSQEDYAQCRIPWVIAGVIPPAFDRLVLSGESYVDETRLARITATAKALGQKAYESERSRTFRGRNLRCGRFAGSDFRLVDFAESDLSGAVLRAAHLDGATFSGARLAGAMMDGAQLQESSLAGKARADTTAAPAAELPNANLRNARLQGANLEGANLDGALLAGAQLQSANLKNAHLARVDFGGAALAGANFENAEMPGANFYSAELAGLKMMGATLDGAYMLRANLTGAFLTEASLRVANLEGARLQGAWLQKVDFRGAMLAVAQLQYADLTSADLRGASLYVANGVAAKFYNADLSGASLDSAQLPATEFSGANLEGASLRGVKLQAAILGRAKLKGAWLEEARLQGASLWQSDLTDATIANAFLWRAGLDRPADCNAANVAEPRFDYVWDIVRSGRGPNRPLRPQEINAAIIEATIDEAKDAPPEILEKLKSDLTSLLNSPADDDAVRDGNKMWTACADATAARIKEKGKSESPDYETSLAAFLIELACTEAPNSKYIAEGILSYLIAAPDSGPPLVMAQSKGAVLARGLLGRDGKTCPGARDIDPKIRESLEGFAKEAPAK